MADAGVTEDLTAVRGWTGLIPGCGRRGYRQGADVLGIPVYGVCSWTSSRCASASAVRCDAGSSRGASRVWWRPTPAQGVYWARYDGCRRVQGLVGAAARSPAAELACRNGDSFTRAFGEGDRACYPDAARSANRHGAARRAGRSAAWLSRCCRGAALSAAADAREPGRPSERRREAPAPICGPDDAARMMPAPMMPAPMMPPDDAGPDDAGPMMPPR